MLCRYAGVLESLKSTLQSSGGKKGVVALHTKQVEDTKQPDQDEIDRISTEANLEQMLSSFTADRWSAHFQKLDQIQSSVNDD